MIEKFRGKAIVTPDETREVEGMSNELAAVEERMEEMAAILQTLERQRCSLSEYVDEMQAEIDRLKEELKSEPWNEENREKIEGDLKSSIASTGSILLTYKEHVAGLEELIARTRTEMTELVGTKKIVESARAKKLN